MCSPQRTAASEALGHESLPVYGGQWHPERLAFEHRREKAVDGGALEFLSAGAACKSGCLAEPESWLF